MGHNVRAPFFKTQCITYFCFSHFRVTAKPAKLNYNTHPREEIIFQSEKWGLTPCVPGSDAADYSQLNSEDEHASCCHLAIEIGTFAST